MYSERSAGNGSQRRTASAIAVRFGFAWSTSVHAATKATAKRGVSAQKNTICAAGEWRMLSWSASASGKPSGSARQNALP